MESSSVAAVGTIMSRIKRRISVQLMPIETHTQVHIAKPINKYYAEAHAVEHSL